jgi:MYXO-CTERM domain-containing protein
MAQRIGSIFGCLAVTLGAGCLDAAAPSEDSVLEDDLGLAVSALTVCNETVPADRNIDGIPAYKQCPESENAAIYSNNGVDTSITQVDKSWTRTQWSGGYQCTEFANRYLQYRWGVKWIPNGNAGEWCNTQPPASSGVVQTMTPVHGDIMVLAPGSCGAAEGTGHVNIIDVVNGEKLIAVEQNGARRGNYNLSCGKCFLHVMANDGVPMPAKTGVPSAPAAGASAPAVPPSMQGAAGGGAATPDQPRRGQRPSMGVAGAAAPAAGAPNNMRAPMVPPAGSTPVIQPTTPAASTPTASTTSSLAAGSGAVTPLSSAVTTPSSSAAAPAEGGCAVAAVGGTSSSSMPLGLALSLLGGLALRSRRRSR